MPNQTVDEVAWSLLGLCRPARADSLQRLFLKAKLTIKNKLCPTYTHTSCGNYSTEDFRKF